MKICTNKKSAFRGMGTVPIEWENHLMFKNKLKTSLGGGEYGGSVCSHSSKMHNAH